MAPIAKAQSIAAIKKGNQSNGRRSGSRKSVNTRGILRFQETPYEESGQLRDNRVAVSAQTSHAAGKPINHRDKAGFNPTALPVSAMDDLEDAP